MRVGSDDVGFFLVDGYDVLGYTTQVEPLIEAMIEETHALGDAWVEQTFVGLRKASFSQQGFYDDAAGASNEALVSKEGTSRILCIGLEGNTIGKKFIGFNGAMQAKYERQASRGALHKANASYEGDGQVDEGVILHGQTAETATWKSVV